MRLTCPQCGAQYEIPDDAIPPAGREVECSSCNHVWFQARQATVQENFDPAARPALSRPLNDSILSILREEAARELDARKSDTAGPAKTRKDADHIIATTFDVATSDVTASDAATSGIAVAAAAPLIDAAAPVPAPVPVPDHSLAPKIADNLDMPDGSIWDVPAEVSADDSDDAALLMDDEPLQLTLPDAAALAATLTRVHSQPAETHPDKAKAALPENTDMAAFDGGADSTADQPSAPVTETPEADLSDMELADTEPGDPQTYLGPKPVLAEPELVRTNDADWLVPDAALPLANTADAPQPPAQMPVPVPAPVKSRGFAMGLGLAMMIAFAFVAFYALAPRLADQGSIGATLMEWRSGVDQGRVWLSEKAQDILPR